MHHRKCATPLPHARHLPLAVHRTQNTPLDKTATEWQRQKGGRGCKAKVLKAKEDRWLGLSFFCRAARLCVHTQARADAAAATVSGKKGEWSGKKARRKRALQCCLLSIIAIIVGCCSSSCSSSSLSHHHHHNHASPRCALASLSQRPTRWNEPSLPCGSVTKLFVFGGCVCCLFGVCLVGWWFGKEDKGV